MALSQETVPALSPSLHRESFHDANSAITSTSDEVDDLEQFEDAAEEHPAFTMDLKTAFEDCEVAISKFFNNDLVGALSIMKPWGRTSLYHSLGTSIFEFIPGILTFDPNQINRAMEALKVCVAICNVHRRSYTFVESLGTMIRKPNYSTYTEMEAHAELCYAEVLLLQAAMSVMEGEDLAALIRATIKLKSCYNSYKDCTKILEKKSWKCEVSRIHFQSGVRLGTATFNVMISLLPPKVISLLEFVGFSGNKALGLSELEAGSNSPGLRAVLCDLTLLAYHLVICHFTGAESNLPLCDKILNRELEIYPESVWFLLFKGRMYLSNGGFDSAIETYNRAIATKDMWRQFRHVCFWEIMWVNGLMLEWRESASYANKLIEESSWSKTIYCYTKAAFLLQLNKDITPSEKQHCKELFRKASTYKQRIAGKSLPMEKFMLRRCRRYFNQNECLTLPAIELLCLWNMMPVLAKNSAKSHAMLKAIELARNYIEFGPSDWMGDYVADNKALVRYLHGCCLAVMGLPRMAIDTLQTVILLKGDIKEDTFLVPYSVAEIAMCYYSLGDNERALQMLHDARRKYSGYSLESRLHFRLHSKIQIVKGNSNNRE